MKKLKYNVTITGTIEKVIEAHNLSEATFIANEKFSDGVWCLLEDDISTTINVDLSSAQDPPIDEELLETHYEIVAAFYTHQESPKLIDIEENKGRGGMYMYAQELTEEFHEKYKDTLWGEELDWHDTLDEFLKEKL